MEAEKTVGAGRIRAFFDAGTFVELGALMRRAGGENENEGVVCGYGALDGRLVFAFAQDPDRMDGALSAGHARKIEMLYERALSVGAPVVGFFDSRGGAVFGGAAMLSGYGRLLSLFADARGRVPQLAVISGVCAGSMAACAALFDFTVTVKGKSRLYVCPPNLTGEPAAREDLAFTAGSEAEAFAWVKELISFLPDNARDGAPLFETADDLNRALTLSGHTTAQAALSAVADDGRFFPLFAGTAGETGVGFLSLGGHSTAYLSLDGALTPAGVHKMTRMLRFAADFGVPVLHLLNATGFAPDQKEESLAADLAALAVELRRPHTAVCAVVGNAVGAGCIFGGTRALGAQLVLALPEAKISSLSAAAAVAFLWNDRITPQVTRGALEEKWEKEEASPLSAAAVGEVDDIVPPAELRARLISAFYMLTGAGEPIARRGV